MNTRIAVVTSTGWVVIDEIFQSGVNEEGEARTKLTAAHCHLALIPATSVGPLAAATASN